MTQHIAILVAIIVLGFAVMTFYRGNSKTKQATYNAADHAGDAAEIVGGYERLIEMERKRRNSAEPKQ